MSGVFNLRILEVIGSNLGEFGTFYDITGFALIFKDAKVMSRLAIVPLEREELSFSGFHNFFAD